MTFTTKQEGYGSQGLYFNFQGNKYYIGSVFPNVKEQFNDFELIDDCFYDEEKNIYTNSNGREVIPIGSWDEFLFYYYKEAIGQILFDNLDHKNYKFDFVKSSYEDVAEWANNL